MSCKPTCRLCKRLVISQAVTFAEGTLTINIPAGNYRNGGKYCLVVAQEIPETATITAPVVVTIGAGTAEYPLNRHDCTQATAGAIRTRTRYTTTVSTNAAGGSFRLAGRLCRAPENAPAFIDGTGTGGGGTA